ncbi:hypothetical protein FBY35_3726 [Streptomyces sp. SLBN-118]|uniref:hypothetical protein n=1 Tax=Streptomyces sp. SLBN-118 TaxID=2768454 RepID=UPI001150B3AA|nr:hypothetical protein [Streptomyces sp. SLBN-118]TQK42339.1 hypothetical protein FBY35_3726 [Streptomyces sp. SLBN-118]
MTSPTAPPQHPVTTNTWPILPLALALLVLRVFGDHSWAYWAAAVVGGLGMIGTAIEIPRAVKRLLARRRSLAASWTIVLLTTACVLLVIRLAES